MKKTYNSPVCKVMTLNVKRDVMDRLFGNTSFIPVGDAGPGTDDTYNGSVTEMYSNRSVWDE